MEPSHYAGTDAIAKQEAVAARLVEMGVPADRAFCAATALKYVERCGKKEGAPIADDMEKAANYLFKAIGGCWPWEACDLLSDEGAKAVTLKDGQRVKRPAPEVLDADGVPICFGDEVWSVTGGLKGVVSQIVRAHDQDWRETACVCVVFGDADHGNFVLPDQLTHRAPVFAADGLPLREGEHVYHVETGTELVVKRLPEPGEYQAVVVFAPPASHLTSFDPDRLTHERPEIDSWERLEEDAGKEACEYFAHMPCGCETSEMLDETVEKCNAAKARDIVRRARALAERGK